MAIQFTPGDEIPFGLEGATEGSGADDMPTVPDNMDLVDGFDPLVDTVDFDDGEGGEEDDELFLSAPGEVKILEQTVRTAPDGRQVVDIVLDVEEVDGADNYEVRITK